MGHRYTGHASEQEAAEERSRMTVTWACLTLRKLDVPFDAEGGAWYVCAFWGWEVAEDAGELASIARRCLHVSREMNRVEGPVAA